MKAKLKQLIKQGFTVTDADQRIAQLDAEVVRLNVQLAMLQPNSAERRALEADIQELLKEMTRFRSWRPIFAGQVVQGRRGTKLQSQRAKVPRPATVSLHSQQTPAPRTGELTAEAQAQHRDAAAFIVALFVDSGFVDLDEADRIEIQQIVSYIGGSLAKTLAKRATREVLPEHWLNRFRALARREIPKTYWRFVFRSVYTPPDERVAPAPPKVIIPASAESPPPYGSMYDRRDTEKPLEPERPATRGDLARLMKERGSAL